MAVNLEKCLINSEAFIVTKVVPNLCQLVPDYNNTLNLAYMYLERSKIQELLWLTDSIINIKDCKAEYIPREKTQVFTSVGLLI